MTIRPASGAQFALRAGGYRADISSVGATLRALTCDGRDLVVPFDADQERPAMRGALLAPWPNRTADGRYRFSGATHQLAINEPATRTASHGLIAWQEFALLEHAPDNLRLATEIEPQPGYPWRVRIEVQFELSADGLRQEITAQNLSATTAPFGLGGHPYLVAGPCGPRALDAWRLELAAESVLLVSADRLLPIAVRSVGEVEDARFDFRSGAVLEGTVLNHAFTGLRRDEAGLTRVRITNARGSGAEIEWDARCRWVQIYTADESVGDEYRHAVAVEPMTCPPDALNSGHDLLSIDPGETVTAGWSIRTAS